MTQSPNGNHINGTAINGNTKRPSSTSAPSSASRTFILTLSHPCLKFNSLCLHFPSNAHHWHTIWSIFFPYQTSTTTKPASKKQGVLQLWLLEWTPQRPCACCLLACLILDISLKPCWVVQQRQRLSGAVCWMLLGLEDEQVGSWWWLMFDDFDKCLQAIDGCHLFRRLMVDGWWFLVIFRGCLRCLRSLFFHVLAFRESEGSRFGSHPSSEATLIKLQHVEQISPQLDPIAVTSWGFYFFPLFGTRNLN